jgi:dienelactone hydrolase
LPVFRALTIVTLALASAGAAVSCGGGEEAPTATTATTASSSLFDYDRSAPLRYEDRGRVNPGYPVRVRDVSYASPGGGRVTAFLVVPPGKGPYPGVLYLHGAGEDRTRLAVPAAWLAARGAVALVIDSAFARTKSSPPKDPLGSLEWGRDLTAQTVVDLRRGVDLLRSLPQVDPERIGFVGYSAGAKMGAILAGVERRVRAYDLMSGGSPPVDAFAAAAPAGIRRQVARVISQIDPLRSIRHAAPAALFFQDGLRDEIVPRPQLRALARAGSDPKRIRWYRAGHSLNARAYRDQLAWLSRELGVDGPVVEGAATGP